jgi:hypothetical protein
MECVLSNYKDVYEYMNSMGATWRTANDFDRYYKGWLKTNPWYVSNASCAYYWWADDFCKKHPEIPPVKMYKLWRMASAVRARNVRKVMAGEEVEAVSMDRAIDLILCWFSWEWK